MGSGVIRKGNGGQNLRPEPALLHPVTALKIDRPGRRDRRGRAPWPCLVTLWLEQGLGEMKLEGFVGQIPEGLKASAWGWAASCRLELKGRRK